MNDEKNNFWRSAIVPALLLLVMWVVKHIEYNWDVDFTKLGVYPLSAAGLIGIITAPFEHENFEHLISNSLPFFLLCLALFYFYKGIAGKILLLIWLTDGICIWLFGRQAYHIGASGIVYGLTSFLFFSGILRRDSRLAAIAMLIVFIYGGLIWGVFPDFFPGKHLSYEAHLYGLLAGVLYALCYRKQGPQRLRYSWELEKEIPDEEEGENIEHSDVYWNEPNNFDDFIFKY
jgi:membrane associated rhomboid family serine protease